MIQTLLGEDSAAGPAEEDLVVDLAALQGEEEEEDSQSPSPMGLWERSLAR